MYRPLDEILHIDLPVDAYQPDVSQEATITASFTGRIIDAGDEYLVSVNGLSYPVTFGPNLNEGQPESCAGRDVQVVAELAPGESLFANEFAPIHIIEIIA